MKYWRGPLLLMHGASGTAESWFNRDTVHGPHDALPLILADLGYEVVTCTHYSKQTEDEAGSLGKPGQTGDFEWDRTFIELANEEIFHLLKSAYQQQLAPVNFKIK